MRGPEPGAVATLAALARPFAVVLLAATLLSCAAPKASNPNVVRPDPDDAAVDGDVDGERTFVPLEAYSVAALEALCAHTVRCGDAFSRVDACMKDAAALGLLVLDQRVNFTGAGYFVYDPEAADRCLDALRVSSCRLAPYESLLETPTGLEACRGVFTPNVEEGDTCQPVYFGTACKDGYCPAGAACASNCTDFAARLGSCAGDTAACNPAADYCDYLGTNTCLPRRSANQTCDRDAACLPGLYCRGLAQRCVASNVGDACATAAECTPNLVCAGSMCREPLAGGANCSVDDTRPCADGLTCAAGKCTEPRAGGEDCTVAAECASGLCRGGMCLGESGFGEACAESGQCPPGIECLPTVNGGDRCGEARGLGEDCSVETGAECEGGLECDLSKTGTCIRPPEGEGDACAMSCPVGTHCGLATGTCDAVLSAGESCVAARSCESGVCTAGKCASHCAT